MQLLFTRDVYGYMNGAIFKLFGVTILIFEFVLLLSSFLGMRRLTPEDFPVVMLTFVGFLLLSTVIAVGLIGLHRWAAMVASGIGLVWSVALAVSLGYKPWQATLVGFPVVFGMLLPLYATITSWRLLKPLDNVSLLTFFHGVRSLDRFHLE